MVKEIMKKQIHIFRTSKRATILISLGIMIFLFLISFISASPPIAEFFQDNVTQLTITINQNQSQANFYLNTFSTSFDTQNLTFDGININFKISDFLDGINGQVEIENGSNVPHFNALFFSTGNINFSLFSDGTTIPPININGTMLFTDLMDNLFNISGISLNSSEINNNISIINGYLADNPLSITSDRNIIFTKNGTDYTIWNDMGYGDIPTENLDQIREIINDTIISINVPDLFLKILPIAEQNNINLSILTDRVDMNYTIRLINLSNMRLKDGSYTITAFVERDNQTYTKDIKIILQGIRNIEEVNVNETYIPIIQEIKDLINKITGLGINGLKVEIFDVFSSFPDNTKPIKYLNMTVENQTSATIEFKHNSANPERVFLYILEDEWVKLPTRFNGSVYEADIPHFSLFVIAEENPPSPVSSSGGRRRYKSVPAPIITPPKNETQNITETPAIVIPPLKGPPEEPWKPDYSSLLLTGSLILLLIVLYFVFKNKKKKNLEKIIKHKV